MTDRPFDSALDQGSDPSTAAAQDRVNDPVKNVVEAGEEWTDPVNAATNDGVNDGVNPATPRAIDEPEQNAQPESVGESMGSTPPEKSGDAVIVPGAADDRRDPVLSPPVLTLAQAVQVTGRSKNTIKARKDKLIAAGTTIDASGWSIPYPALIQVGLLDSVSPPEVPTAQADLKTQHDPLTAGVNSGVKEGVNVGENRDVDPGHDRVNGVELAQLRSEVSDLRHRVALAEAIAVERDRVIDVQNRALRMLEVGTSAPAPHVAAQLSTQLSTQPESGSESGSRPTPARVKKRRWFSQR